MCNRNREELLQRLFGMQDQTYQAFQAKLIPNIAPETILGVRTPQLRKLAKELPADYQPALPCEFFEEKQICAFLLEREKCFETAVNKVDAFLPYVDNWATCDQLNPRVFKKHREALLPHICRWISSEHTYAVRFGIKMLMDHYLDDAFKPEYPELVAKVDRQDYYVRMVQAWYFATALAKQYDAVMVYIENGRLDPWVHNKTIQKAVESYRITPERKEHLKQFRIK